MSKGILLPVEALFELHVGYSAPRGEEAHKLFAIQCVTSICGQSSLALVDAEVEAPGFPHGALAEQVVLRCEEAGKTALLLLLDSLEVLRIVDLSLNSHVHFDQPVITSARVMVIVDLVLTHVASTHITILCDKPLLELFE